MENAGKRGRTLADRLEHISILAVTGITKILGRLGLPGLSLFILIFVASDEQRKAIIDRWILFKGEDPVGKSGVVPVIFGIIVVFLAQGYYFRKEKEVLKAQLILKDKEIERLQTLVLKKGKKKKDK